MRLLMTLTVCCWVAMQIACHGTETFEWPTEMSLTASERTALEVQSLTILTMLGLDHVQFKKRTVRFEDRKTFRHVDHDEVFIRFWRSGETHLDVGLFYPPTNGVRYFHDDGVERRNAPDTDRPVKTTQEQALGRAKEIARLIGKMDLDDQTKWQVFCKGFVRKDWLFHWRPLIGGYPAPSQVIVQLADDDKLSLVTFQNGVYHLPEVKTDVKINQQDARKRADQYLERYYRKNELKTLQFSTNVLEIVVPNYAFTPQDTGYEGWANPTNSPVLVWKAVYARKNNTLEQTPVQIWVDADDGSMRGGWE